MPPTSAPDREANPAAGSPSIGGHGWHRPTSSGWDETIRAALLALVFSAVILIPGGWMVYADWSEREAERLALMPKPWLLDELHAKPALPALSAELASAGKAVFLSTCVACHGMDGKGIPSLGKNLVNSWFIASKDDAALEHFVKIGRNILDPANTMKMPMPPKGNRPELTDADLKAVVAYVRALQDPRRMPALPTATTVAYTAPTADETKKWLTAAGGDEELAGYIANGSKLYATTCIACHGPDARGTKGNGKDLVASEFVAKNDDDAMLAFVKKGRNPGDPANTTGIDMPPKGGNPALNDDDLLDIIAYVRALHVTSAKN